MCLDLDFGFFFIIHFLSSHVRDILNFVLLKVVFWITWKVLRLFVRLESREGLMINTEMLTASSFIHQDWKRGYINNNFQLSFKLVPLGHSFACLLFMGYCLWFQHHMFLVNGQVINQLKFCYGCFHSPTLPLGHLGL